MLSAKKVKELTLELASLKFSGKWKYLASIPVRIKPLLKSHIPCAFVIYFKNVFHVPLL